MMTKLLSHFCSHCKNDDIVLCCYFTNETFDEFFQEGQDFSGDKTKKCKQKKLTFF